MACRSAALAADPCARRTCKTGDVTDQDGECRWRKAGPASREVIEALKTQATVALPPEYLDFLSQTNGGEGDLAADPGWFAIWPSEEVLENNRGYEILTYLPGFFGFGSNGGGELLAFDMRHGAPYPVVMIPFIPMEAREARPVAATFAEFRTLLGKRWEDQA